MEIYYDLGVALTKDPLSSNTNRFGWEEGSLARFMDNLYNENPQKNWSFHKVNEELESCGFNRLHLENLLTIVMGES